MGRKKQQQQNKKVKAHHTPFSAPSPAARVVKKSRAAKSSSGRSGTEERHAKAKYEKKKLLKFGNEQLRHLREELQDTLFEKSTTTDSEVVRVVDNTSNVDNGVIDLTDSDYDLVPKNPVSTNTPRKRKRRKEHESPHFVKEHVAVETKADVNNEKYSADDADIVDTGTVLRVEDVQPPKKKSRSASRRYFEPEDLSVQCFRCRGRGHLSYECPNDPFEDPCYMCGRSGHNYRDCPFNACFRCFLPGHLAMDCKSSKLNPSICLKCGCTKHLLPDCKVGTLPDSEEYKQDLSALRCFVCGDYGHINCCHVASRNTKTLFVQYCANCASTRHATNRCTEEIMSWNNSNYVSGDLGSLCFLCNEKGHQKKDCPSLFANRKGRNSLSRYNSFTCHRCGLPGHMAKLCPQNSAPVGYHPRGTFQLSASKSAYGSNRFYHGGTYGQSHEAVRHEDNRTHSSRSWKAYENDAIRHNRENVRNASGSEKNKKGEGKKNRSFERKAQR